MDPQQRPLTGKSHEPTVTRNTMIKPHKKTSARTLDPHREGEGTYDIRRAPRKCFRFYVIQAVNKKYIVYMYELPSIFLGSPRDMDYISTLVAPVLQAYVHA